MVRSAVPPSICAVLCFPAFIAAQSAPASNVLSAQFKTSTELVVLDVVATGADKNPVQHLTASDFTVFENGKPQSIKVFEEHDAATPVPIAPMPKLEPGAYTNFSPAPTSSAVNVILLDMQNTPYNAQAIVRSQALKFLDELRPGTQLAIFSLTDRLNLVQGFTADPTVLRAQLKSSKGNPIPSRQLVQVSRGAEMEADGPDTIPGGDNTSGGSGGAADAALAYIDAASKQSLAELAADQVRRRGETTLAAMNQLARYLSNIPGRKNLIWFSSSFPITILPDPAAAPLDPFAIETSTQNEFKQTVDLLALSRVAVYPVSATGLAMPLYRPDRGGPPPPDALPQFVNKLTDLAATMYQVAEATGGKAYVNTNGLSEAAEDAIRNGSSYYTIAYAPSDKNWNGDYRKIEVKLDKPVAALEYRRGYYAGDTFKAAPQVKQVSNAKPSEPPYNPLRTAMLHSAPNPSQLIFVADIKPSVPNAEPAAAQGNYPATGVAGPFRRYTVDFLAPPAAVHCDSTKDGAFHCALQFLAIVYDSDGKLVNSEENNVSFNASPDRYDWLRKNPFSYSQQISVPAQGEHFLRVGMRDLTNDRIGTLELPVAEISNLPALSSARANLAPAAAGTR